MADAYREMYPLNEEDNMDKMRKAAKGAMQTIKFKDGKLHVDSFTASGLMQIYDKVNPKNKTAMEKIINHGSKQQILRLQSFAMKKLSNQAVNFIRGEEVEVDEAKDYHAPMVKGKRVGGSSKLFNKSATGYSIYHKTFSAAMQHAYAHAKKKFGITIDPNEIDQKVASGPKKPSSGKTNRYGLKGDKGGIQVQVYNTGDDYELNMYKEEVELDEATEKDILIALKREKLGGYFSGGKLYVAQRALETVRDLLRGMKLKSMPKLVGENLKEGAWQLPVGPKGRAGLKKLMKKPIKAKDSIDAIDPYIGDDELWDDLGELDDEDPNQDVRPTIKAAMKRLGIKENMRVYQDAISKLVSEHKGKKPHKHPHPEGGPLATVDEKFTMKDFKSNEDGNDHTQNAVELVKMFGDNYEKRQVAQIQKDHDKNRSISAKDQKVRDALIKKYLPQLEEDLDEKVRYSAPTKDGKNTFQVIDRDTKGMRGKQDDYKMVIVDKKGKVVKDWGSHISVDGAVMMAKNKKIIEDVELDESGRLGFKDIEKFGRSAASRIDNEARRTSGYDKMSPGEKDQLRYKIAKKLGMKVEEVELVEGSNSDVIVMKKGRVGKSVLPDAREIKKLEKEGWKIEGVIEKGSKILHKDPKRIMKAIKGGDKLGIGESLEEGKMKELHMYIQQKKSAEWIAKKMSLDVKTVKQLMPEETVLKRVDRFLESARSDAMKAMRGDPDLKNIKGKDDDDETATDDDVKAASKNIIAQMRKVVSLRGKFKVEFQDGKKEKIDPKIAAAIQKKYNSMRRPADKEKFQSEISKSKKDLLSALKESLQEADAPSKAADASAKIQQKKKIAGDKAKQDALASAKEKKSEAEQKKKAGAAAAVQKKLAVKNTAEKDKKTMQQAQGADQASATQAKIAGEKEADKAKRDAKIAQAKKKTDADAEKREKERAGQQHKTQMAASYNPILSRIDEKIQERKNG